MAFNGLNLTPIGGNSRSGIKKERNAPMGWAYSSEDDSVSDVLTAGYFDSINKIVAADQFIYASLTDNNVIFTIQSVDRLLQQVVLYNSYMQPVPDGIVTANPQTGVEDNFPVFADDSALVIKDSGKPTTWLEEPADSVTKVYTQDNFGPSVSDVITLVDFQEKYRVMKLVTMTSRIVAAGFPTPSFNEIESTFLGINVLHFEGAGSPVVFWTAPFSFFFNCVRQAFFDTSNGAPPPFVKGENTFMDINGIAPAIPSFATFDAAQFVNWKQLGNARNLDSFTMRNGIANNSGGMILDNCASITIAGMTLGNFQDEGDTYVDIIGGNDTFVQIMNDSFIVQNTEAAVNIDPNIGENSVVVIQDIRNTLIGGGEFFRSGDTGNITSFADNTSTGSVTVVTDNMNGTATVTTSVAHGLFVYQDVALSSMTIPAYDGTYEILVTPTTTTFIIILTASAGTATGTWDADSVMVTSAAHGQSDGQTMLITDSIFYDGGAKIYNSTTNTFDINREWDATHTGVWDTGSLTERDKRVTTESVQTIPDSQNLFSLAVIDGTPTTIIAQDAWADITISSAEIDLNGTENFSLVGLTNGEFRYDGPQPRTIGVSGFITAVKTAGGLQTYDFITAVNDIPLTATLPKTRLTCSSGVSGTSSISGAVQIDPGDLIKLQVFGVGTSGDIIIQQLSFIGK